MGKRIKFPTKYARDKQFCKKAIIEMMALIKKSTPVPKEVEKDISKIMLDVCMEKHPSFQFSLEIPTTVSLIDRKVVESSFSNTIKDFNERITQFNQEVLVKRLELEARIYLLRNK